MSKTIKSAVFALAILSCIFATQALLTPPASAASGCWKVDCNTCCKLAHGGTVCTQRACP